MLHALKNGSAAIPPKNPVEDGRDDSVASFECSSSLAQAPKEDEKGGGKKRRGGGKGVGKDERRSEKKREGKERKGREGKDVPMTVRMKQPQ